MFMKSTQKRLTASATSKKGSLIRPAGDPTTLFAIRLLAAGALVVAAYLHVSLALQQGLMDKPISLAQLFMVQAAMMTAVAALLLFRPGNRIWQVAVLLALGSAAALLASVYFPLPAVGPFPAIDEPVWYSEKVLSLVAELAVPVLWLIRRIAPPHH
jgi:ABC-type Fe3+-siderophore transport system permease subunit